MRVLPYYNAHRIRRELSKDSIEGTH